MSIVIILLAATMGYLCGSLSFARLIARLYAPDFDVSRDVAMPVAGSDESFMVSSVSATSVSNKLGPRYGCLTALLDILKVALPTLAFHWRYPGDYYHLIAAVAGLIGHNWPLYYRFKGGRGFTAIYGGMAVIDWLGIPVTALLGMVLGLGVFRDVFLTYNLGLWLLIPWLAWRRPGWPHLAYAIAINVIYLLAMIPEIKQYLHFRKLGQVDFTAAMESSDMGRGMMKMMRMLDKLKKR